jgi:hypothetical protein
VFLVPPVSQRSLAPKTLARRPANQLRTNRPPAQPRNCKPRANSQLRCSAKNDLSVSNMHTREYRAGRPLSLLSLFTALLRGMLIFRSRRQVPHKRLRCVPSHPMEVCTLQDDGCDLFLHKWWENWRHNIASSVGTVRNIGPLFLVLDTEQFANCYYEGQETATSLKLSGRVTNGARAGLEAGFRGREDGHHISLEGNGLFSSDPRSFILFGSRC